MWKYFSLWDNGHAYGWDLFRGDRKIAQFDYIGGDCMSMSVSFRLSCFSERAEDRELLAPGRKSLPDPSVAYRNRKLDVVVSDNDFSCKVWEDGIVSLRDFRTPPRTLFSWFGDVITHLFSRTDKEDACPNR